MLVVFLRHLTRLLVLQTPLAKSETSAMGQTSQLHRNTIVMWSISIVNGVEPQGELGLGDANTCKLDLIFSMVPALHSVVLDHKRVSRT